MNSLLNMKRSISNLQIEAAVKNDGGGGGRGSTIREHSNGGEECIWF